MTCALVTYRDYFTPINRHKGTKTESLHQYSIDLAEALDEEVKIMNTSELARGKVDLDSFDSIAIFEHPTSSIHGPLGFTTPSIDVHVSQLQAILQFKKQVWSCRVEHEKWEKWSATMLKRALNPRTLDLPWPNKKELASLGILAMEGNVTEKYEQVRLARRDWAIGDSHATMLWKPGRTVEAIFGKTLFSALRDGLEIYSPPDLERAHFCFGNIDLRHHILRYPNAEQMVMEMAEEYVKQARSLAKEVSICSLLPEINPERKLKKAYWHKGTPSFGSPKERSIVAQMFREALRNYSKGTNVTIIDPPESIKGDEWFKEECLETNGLHLRTDCYEWSAETKCHRPEFTFSPVS